MEGQKRELTETEKRVVAARKRYNKAHHELMEATFEHMTATKKKSKTTDTTTPFACAGDVISGTPCDQDKAAVPSTSTRYNGTIHQTCTSCKKKIKRARLMTE